MPLFHAAARTEPGGLPLLRLAREPRPEGLSLVEAQDLVFCYQDRGEPVLRQCSFRIRPEDRILLQGHSGDGQVDPGLTSDRHAHAAIGAAAAGRTGLADLGDRWVAPVHRLRAAIPREPCFDGDVRLQPAHGPRLASDPERYG